MVHVLMIGGVLAACVAFPALLFAAFEGEAMLPALIGIVAGGAMMLAATLLATTPFSPDYIVTLRWLGGIAAASFMMRRR